MVGVDASPYPGVMELTAAITHEGELFVARCLEVDVKSQGESMNDALSTLSGYVRHLRPERIVAAVVEFLLGPLSENPRRVGHQLQRELAGLWSARRGAYRVIYEI